MPEIASSDFCRTLCCLPERNKEKTPLIQSIATSCQRRTARAQYCIPSTKKQEQNVDHTALSRERLFIINELVKTERRYVERLTVLDVEFMQALVKLKSNCDPLRKLCTQIQLLKKYHSVLLENLLAGKSVAYVFNKTGDFLKLTQDYIDLHPEVSGMIEKFSYQSKKFRQCIKKSELMHQVQLNSLLIEPVQRIPRYQLLLEDLVANTPKAHPEFENLLKALRKILAIILKLNETESSCQRRSMWSVYQKIRGRGSSLWAPSRKFVRKDVFWRAYNSENLECIPPVKVRAFLFTDCIIICDGRKVNRNYKFLEEIRLCDISSLEYFNEPLISLRNDNTSADLYGFKLSADGHKMFGLYHSNRAEVKMWFELIIKYRKENAKIDHTRRNYIKNKASTQLHPDLQYGTMSNSTIVSPSEVTSNYDSISKCNYAMPRSTAVGSLEIIRNNKSLSDSESLVTWSGHGVEYTSSSNESDDQSVYKTTSMFENLKKLVRTKHAKYIKVSDILTSASSCDEESVFELNNDLAEKARDDRQLKLTPKKKNLFLLSPEGGDRRLQIH